MKGFVEESVGVNREHVWVNEWTTMTQLIGESIAKNLSGDDVYMVGCAGNIALPLHVFHFISACPWGRLIPKLSSSSTTSSASIK